jgi:hypothetical protein
MTPVVASATDLPFANGSFDGVVASDVLEHIPPEMRTKVISEAMRVGRQMVIFGFPCGKNAHQADTALRDVYLKTHREVPIWLEEHMLADFPDESLFAELPGWDVGQFGNENIGFHTSMMRWEMNRVLVRFSNLSVKLAPRILEPLLRRADFPPYYRQIFALTRRK